MEDTTDTSSLDDKVFSEIHDAVSPKNPKVLPKSYILQAIDMILQPTQSKKQSGRNAKIDNNYCKKSATRVISICADRTHLPYYCSRKPTNTIDSSLTPILKEMRHCLLTCEWDKYKELLLMLLQSPNIRTDFNVFAIRSCFVLLLNHPNRTPELLDNFMTACLGLDQVTRRIQYLKDCFSLKGDSACTTEKNTLVEVTIENEEDDVSMIFNSDFSSDADV